MKNEKLIKSLASLWGPFWGVQPAFIEAIVAIESSGRSQLVNRSARAEALGFAWGLMQITGVTSRDVWRQAKPALDTGALTAGTFEMREACVHVLHVWAAGRNPLLDPDANVCLGTRYLLRLQERFGPVFLHIAAAYHQGPARVARFLKEGRAIPDQLPPNGKEYVRRALLAFGSAEKGEGVA